MKKYKQVLFLLFLILLVGCTKTNQEKSLQQTEGGLYDQNKNFDLNNETNQNNTMKADRTPENNRIDQKTSKNHRPIRRAHTVPFN